MDKKQDKTEGKPNAAKGDAKDAVSGAIGPVSKKQGGRPEDMGNHAEKDVAKGETDKT